MVDGGARRLVGVQDQCGWKVAAAGLVGADASPKLGSPATTTTAALVHRHHLTQAHRVVMDRRIKSYIQPVEGVLVVLGGIQTLTISGVVSSFAEGPRALADNNDGGDVLMEYRQVGDVVSFVQVLSGVVGAVVQVVAVLVHHQLAAGVPQRRHPVMHTVEGVGVVKAPRVMHHSRLVGVVLYVIVEQPHPSYSRTLDRVVEVVAVEVRDRLVEVMINPIEVRIGEGAALIHVRPLVFCLGDDGSQQQQH